MTHHTETFEETVATLAVRIDVLLTEVIAHRAEQRRIAAILAQFYQAGCSISSLQPILDLAVELNPGLTSQ